LETPEADDHYTERLFRSPTLNTVYHRPRLEGPVPPREHFGFDPEQHIYLCPQTLYKLHPDFDEVLARILQQDPHGYLVLLEGRISQWTERLRRRFQRTLPNGGARVRFLPGQSYPHFLALLAAADVILDPLYFSGGNTSYEAFAMQTPIVTWPGRFMRGRVTFALYQKMGIDDLIVHSIDEYVTLAVRIASEPAFRQGLRQRIGQRNDRLFHDRQDLRGLETFLDACREGRALAPDHGV
jgi:protein O-GlcNAc transferase